MPTAKSLIESLGVYLPSKQVTTAEILQGCAYPLRIPLERLTGIQSRHCAGDTEFSFDLAVKAMEDCLQRSHVAPQDIDVLICTNISRYDGPRQVTYEPTTSVKLRKRFGLSRAVVWDISNACAGMWTGIYVVDAMIRSGSIRHGMVVSGEYISYLAETAQKEIASQVDPQLASLTLGDAGLAVILAASSRPDVGFHDIELYTLSKYSRFCIAQPTEREHGGAAMHTDVIKVTAAVVPHAATHAHHVLMRCGRPLQDVDHIIPHQTSRLTMQGAVDELKRRFDQDLSGRLVNNLAHRGNTATTSHMLALRDSILEQRIHSGDDILFSISGSGQTTGTAFYTCDDLPDRLRADAHNENGNGRAKLDAGTTLAVPMNIESIATAYPAPGTEPDTLTLLEQAGRACLERSAYDKCEIDLLTFTGVYRTNFVTEPAIAALLAGDLSVNEICSPDAPHKTLALDVFNGALGTLQACYLAAELARAGRLRRAMVVSAEVENNRHESPGHLLGLREMASAMILQESDDGESGFHAFGFYYYYQYEATRIVTGTWNERGRPCLIARLAPELPRIYLDCIEQAVDQFLAEQEVTRAQIALLLPPQFSPAFVDDIAQRLAFPPGRYVNAAVAGTDLFTSSLPVCMQTVREQQLASPGDLGLVVAIGNGVQVGCALYRF